MTPTRLLCAVVALLGCILAALLLVTCEAVLDHANRQRSIVESLLKPDGTVYALYGDYQYEPPPVAAGGLSLVLGSGQRVHGFSVRGEPSRLQRLLVAIFGVHACTNVSAVYWEDQPVSDDDLQLLQQVPQLRELYLDGTNVTDRGLMQIAALRQLTVLDLSKTRITSRGVGQLAACAELRELDLSGTDVDEESIEQLRQALPACEIRK